MYAACNVGDLTPYTLEVVTYETGEHVCTLDGVDIYRAHDLCNYDNPIDNYVLRLIRPKHESVGCAVTVEHNGDPTRDEVTDQCGLESWLNIQSGAAEMLYHHQTEQRPPAIICPAPDLASGAGLYDQAYEASNLWTDRPLEMLAGRLIWYGVVVPDCPGGYSGLDPMTRAADACGMAQSRSKVIEWQNQWDVEIYNAAKDAKVPARLLKRVMGIESQYWPLYIGAWGERGVMQISEYGAETLMRYDAAYKPGYVSLSDGDQFWERLGVRNSFDCVNCDLAQALDKTRAEIPLYARLLAAYRCRAVSITPSLSGRDAWQQAVVDYNGSGEYLLRIEQQ